MASKKPRIVTVRASQIAAHPTHRMDAEYWLENAEPQRIGDIACPPSKAVLDATDTIKRGDRVSWCIDGVTPRQFGRVVRLCVKDFHRAFSVREDGTGMGRIIPARFITKECG